MILQLLNLLLIATFAAAAPGTEELKHACDAARTGAAPAVLQTEIDLCKKQFEFFHCRAVTKDWPELQKRLRKCDAASVCRGDVAPFSGFYGFGKGLVDNTVDNVKAAGQYLYNEGYVGTQSTFEIAKKCDALPACKRAVAADVPWRRQQTDADLRSVGSLQLESEALLAQGFAKLSDLAASAGACMAHPSKISAGAQELAARADDWQSTQQILMAMRYYCLDQQGQGELVGYTTAYAVDPLAAGAAVARSKFLIEAFSASKGAAIERGTETLSGERRANTSGQIARSSEEAAKAKQAFIDSHLNGNFTTVEQNEKFVALARATAPDGKTQFFDIENSQMKRLNDQTRDKNFVTSLTNRHKELVFEGLKQLEANNPGLELVPYSDFKSVRIAARGKIPADLEAQMQTMLARANADYAGELTSRQLIRESDAPKNWFRAGMGETADQANLSARAARDQAESSNKMLSFNSEALQRRMSTRVQEVETLRAQTTRDLEATKLLEPVAGTEGKKTLSRDAFDLVRKYPDPDALQSVIQKRYGQADFTRSQAETMLNYAKSVDEFSPGIHVVKREIVNLDDAAHGGFSIDFLGLGSSNQRATADGLARATDLKDALVQTRKGEQGVTGDFHQRIERFKQIAGPFAKCSGDDCIGVATAKLNHVDKLNFLNRLAADDLTRGIRVSFVPDGVAVRADRTTLATHGESIEKFFRKSLEGKVPYEKMTNTLFAVDMQTKAANAGAVDLIAASKPGVKWTSKEWQEIENAFAYAVEAHNKDLAKENVVSRYVAKQSTCASGAGLRACELTAP